MDEKYQYEYPNAHYLANINNLNQSNMAIQLNRLPTLGEILANKTKSPVSLYNFYSYMRDIENNSDYIDFWFDLVNHLNLCKHYIKGLRDSIARQSSHHDSRASGSIFVRGNTTSVTSSMLLDLILDDNLLLENDSNRLSQFLRGDLELNPRLSDLINQYDRQQFSDTRVKRSSTANNSSISLGNRPASAINDRPKRVSSADQLLEDDSFVENQLDLDKEDDYVFTQPRYVSLDQDPPSKSKRVSSLNPDTVEKLLKTANESAHSSFITRDKLKDSTKNLLLKYFVEDSEKNLNLPEATNSEIIKAIEVEGRDDPDLFNNVKVYVFNRLENYYLPNFLNMVAIRNINRINSNVLLSGMRIILGFFLIFIGFWMGYIFIFLNFKKSHRLYIIIPFVIGSYCLISSIYLIDPILVLLGYSQSLSRDRYFIKIEEKFIRKLLIKRSMWVSVFILIWAAVFVIIFSLVPGHRL